MPFNIIRNDITKIKCDAVVNAANSSLQNGGGVNGAIHRAAGPELLEECRTLGECAAGDAKITGGYDMLCRYIIHTVGPVWKDGMSGEEETLRSCYRKSLELAERFGCRSIAFPLISSGAFGYPKEQAFAAASDEIRKYLESSEISVTMVVFDSAAVAVSEKLAGDIKKYIDDNFVQNVFMSDVYRKRVPFSHSPLWNRKDKKISSKESVSESECYDEVISCIGSLAIPELDESFSQALLRIIDQKGFSDVEVYKKANIDRRLFSKIRADNGYRPKKQTAVAFAVALELDVSQTQSLLEKAGYTLSGSIKFDVIIKYFLEKGIYDIYQINQVLFSMDQTLLGS